jgi:hypothetical protein
VVRQICGSDIRTIDTLRLIGRVGVNAIKVPSNPPKAESDPTA